LICLKSDRISTNKEKSLSSADGLIIKQRGYAADNSTGSMIDGLIDPVEIGNILIGSGSH
jgi:hypothetical protein